jgi:uncharacterized protein
VTAPSRTDDHPRASPPSADPSPQGGPKALARVQQRVLAASLLTLVTLAPLTGREGSPVPDGLVLLGLAGLTVWCGLAGDRPTTRLGLGLSAIAITTALPWQISWWPIPAAVGLCVYFIIHARARRDAHPPPAVVRAGRLGVRDSLYVMALVLVSAAALLVFLQFAPPRDGPATVLLTALEPGPLAAVGVAFAMLNAVIEEVLYRGVILHHLRCAMGVWPAVGLQAIAFGMLHLHSYPYGPVGVGLAAIYGVLLGLVRVHTGGLLACWIAHFCADVVIFAVLAEAAA